MAIFTFSSHYYSVGWPKCTDWPRKPAGVGQYKLCAANRVEHLHMANQLDHRDPAPFSPKASIFVCFLGCTGKWKLNFFLQHIVAKDKHIQSIIVKTAHGFPGMGHNWLAHDVK